MNNMKKIGWLILATIISKHAFAIGELKPPFTPTATYAWSLTQPGSLTLYKNVSQSGVGFIYTNNPDSDSVVIRCPLSDTVLQPN